MGLEGAMLDSYVNRIAGPAPAAKSKAPPAATFSTPVQEKPKAPAAPKAPSQPPPPTFSMAPEQSGTTPAQRAYGQLKALGPGAVQQGIERLGDTEAGAALRSAWEADRAAPGAANAYETYTGRYSDPRAGTYEKVTGRPYYEEGVVPGGPPPMTQTTAYRAGTTVANVDKAVSGLGETLASAAIGMRAAERDAAKSKAQVDLVSPVVGRAVDAALSQQRAVQAGFSDQRAGIAQPPVVVTRPAPRPAPAPTPVQAAPPAPPPVRAAPSRPPPMAPEVRAMYEEMVRSGIGEGKFTKYLNDPNRDAIIQSTYQTWKSRQQR